MTNQIPAIAAAYVRAINDHATGAFISLFADDAVVSDNGREFRGLAAIQAWGDSDIFEAQVTLEVIAVAERDGATIVSAKVDGNFDRTGLPDPVVIDHQFAEEGGKIVCLTCGLAVR